MVALTSPRDSSSSSSWCAAGRAASRRLKLLCLLCGSMASLVLVPPIPYLLTDE